MDAVSATEEPEIAPKKVDARILTSDKPPRTKPINTPANATRRLDMPPSAMIAPASTKQGMANKENLLTPLAIWIMTASSGRSIHMAPIKAARPKAYATGMPTSINKIKLPIKTSASMIKLPLLM